MPNETSDREGDALQGLLDAFPSAPLELIASAYIQAHSDQGLAAEIIALSLDGTSSELSSGNGVSRGAPDVSHSKTSSKSLKPASHRPFPRSRRGPCPPTLEEYFPSSPEENAWIKPLSPRLQEEMSLQNQAREMQLPVSSVDFPSLEKKTSNGKGQKLCCSDMSQPLGSRGQSMSRASAAFGLASSARSTRGDKKTKDKDLVKQLKQSKQQAVKAEEVSLWPTETEASLLSMLGDGFNLEIEAVRDVLGYFKGNIQKSFEALQQLNSSSSSNDQPHAEVSTLGTLSQISSSVSENFKEVAAVESMVETGEISSMTNGDNSGTMNLDTLQTYYAFEKAILQHDNSSMKWVVERLCDKYPHADVATLLEVLRATKFSLNDAEKMLQEACLHEGSPGADERKDPCQLAKTILESLFSEPQEVTVDCEEKCKKSITRQKKEKVAEAVEVPNWKAVTSAELTMLEDEEGIGERKLVDLDKLTKVVKGSTVPTSKKEEGRTSYGDWDDFERHQASAKQHWKTMQSYLTAATAAYASSDCHKAELLTEKGNLYKQLSMEAKERANTCFLGIKNRQSESDFTLDLQEQHIPEALQLLRLHLKSFSSIPSCHTFTVVTGCFENPKSGHKRIKQEVTGYLEKKGYKWVETSPFCLQIQMRETKQMEE